MSSEEGNDAAKSSAPEASTSTSSPDVDSYQQLYEDIKGKPCRVAHIGKVYEDRPPDSPPLRTKPSIIDRELQRVHAANTLEELQEALEETGRNLQQLGCFSRVEMLVTEEPQDEPDACTVLIDLREKNWYKVHAATYFQGGESTLEVGAGLHNATGNAEHVTATAEFGTQLSNQCSVTYEQPRPWGLPVQAEARAHVYTRNHIKASSYSEKLRGIVLGAKSLGGRHALQYELGWRSVLVDVTATGASRAVQLQSGDFLKSAARYTLFLDGRNHPGVPNQGWAVRSTSELSGLGPDQSLRYAKQQVDVQLLLPITSLITFNLIASAGVMLPWGFESPGESLARASCIADRFFLGGPSTLRGFKYQGVGPTDERSSRYTRLDSRPSGGGTGPDGASGAHREGADAAPPAPRRDALGGDLYSSVLAEITCPLPHKALRALNILGHVFVNGGNCSLLAGTGQPLQEGLRSWASSWRWSAGVGLVLPTWFGRFEANYVHVLSAQEHDRVKRGMQLGFASAPFAN